MEEFTPIATWEQIQQAEEFFRGLFWDKQSWYQNHISYIKILHTNKQELETFSQLHSQNMHAIQALCYTILEEDDKQQVIKKAKQTIELVFMNPCRICPESENIDSKFILQWIKDLANDEDKIREEAIHLSIDVDIFKIALAQILQST